MDIPTIISTITTILTFLSLVIPLLVDLIKDFKKNGKFDNHKIKGTINLINEFLKKFKDEKKDKK